MTKNKPLLSIIVPVYNQERYINECVKSILKQKYLTLEIILVDDGSSDQSGVLCDALAEENASIKVLHVKNGGVSKARFLGVKVSKGDWITFVDADDWIDENAYKDIILENSCDLVITGICRYIDAKHQIMQLPYLREGAFNKKEIIDEIVPVMLWNPRQETWALDPSLCTKIFKRKIILEYLEKSSEIDSHYGDDSTVIFPLMLQVESVQIIRKIYYYHRQRGAGEIPPYIKDEDFISKLYKVYENLKRRFQETPYWEVMKPQLDCFYINSVELKKRCYEYPQLEILAHFPFDRIPQESRVVLYGAGNLGKQYWEQNFRYHFCKIVSWVDGNYRTKEMEHHVIENPEVIKKGDFDYVVIAVDDYYVAKEIALYLNELGVKKEQIVWHSIRANHKEFEECSPKGEKPI